MLLIFLCCLVMTSAVLSFGLMLWFVVLGIVWFIMPGMKEGRGQPTEVPIGRRGEPRSRLDSRAV